MSNFSVNIIKPERPQTGKPTFAVVDNKKRAAVAFYPASEFPSETETAKQQVLARYKQEQRLG